MLAPAALDHWAPPRLRNSGYGPVLTFILVKSVFITLIGLAISFSSV